jgi:YVTN family beta-propeller protein
VTYRSIQIEKGSPRYAAINPNTNLIYIFYPTSNFILIVNLSNGSMEGKIPVNSPGNIVINNVTNEVYVSSAYGICEIDGINNQHGMINIGLPHSYGCVDVNPSTNLLYTTCFGHDILTVIDAATHRIAEKIPVGEDPKGVAVDICGNKTYVANNVSQSIFVIDCHNSNEIVDTIDLGARWYQQAITAIATNPNFVFVNEKAHLLYVQVYQYVSAGGGPYEGNSLLIIEINSKKEIKTLGLPSNAEAWFVFNPIINALYMKKIMRRQF